MSRFVKPFQNKDNEKRAWKMVSKFTNVSQIIYQCLTQILVLTTHYRQQGKHFEPLT